METHYREPSSYGEHLQLLDVARGIFFEETNGLLTTHPEQRDFHKFTEASEELSERFSSAARFIVEDDLLFEEKLQMLRLLQLSEDKKRVTALNEMMGEPVCETARTLPTTTPDGEVYFVNDEVLHKNSVSCFNTFLTGDVENCLEHIDEKTYREINESEQTMNLEINAPEHTRFGAREYLLGSVAIATGVTLGIVIGKRINRKY